MIGFLLRRQYQVPVHDDWLTPAERRWFTDRRSAKRVADWRLGRWTAKAAVAAYLEHHKRPVPRSIEILAAEDGAPEAFASRQALPVALSLSHSHGLAVAAVAPADTLLGCDIERIETRSQAFVGSYLSRTERNTLTTTEEADRPLIVTLLWSAKESALKALRQGLTVDTRSLEVIANPIADRSWGRLEIRTQPTSLTGRWTRRNDMILTLVASPAIDHITELE